ncbi:MAG: hypothetical protein GX776_01660 [Oxalobacter sp.]|nr:hypothetical protein [Oxalobacter sp.]
MYTIHVRRDAHTLTPVFVPEYEIALLQALFGTENVLNSDNARADENGNGTAAGDFKAAEDEYARLEIKYGEELVESVYGKRMTRALDNAIEAAKKPRAGRGRSDAAKD